MTDFTIEEALIDKYVDIKDDGKGEPIAVELIKNHFLPQGRFEEARSWRNALTDKALKGEVDKLIKAAATKSKAVAISRIPQNKDWSDTSATGRSETTDDQQYHYDRTLGYMVAMREMEDDAEDVEVCRNEWITFVARNAYSGLEKVGAEFDTIAMAISDYIEMFLLAGKLPAVESAKSSSKPAQQELPTVEKALVGRDDILNLLQSKYPSVLKATFISKIVDTFTKVTGGQKQEILFTDHGIIFMTRERRGGVTGESQFIPVGKITNLEVGSETHTEHAGFTSTTADYWILTVNTTDYESYSRWLYLGANESEINVNRPFIMRALGPASQFYQIDEGDSWQTSGGFQTSFGFGVIW